MILHSRLFMIMALGGILAVILGLTLISGESQSGSTFKPVSMVAPDKRGYKFQQHLEGPYPFDYEAPIPVGLCPQMFGDLIDFGSYTLDEEKPLKATDREPSDSPPDLSELRWHVEKRTYPRLLGALAEALPPALASSGPPRGVVGQAFLVSVSEDAPTAVAMAEAGIRMASRKKLPRALNRLAGAYWMGKKFDKLEALLEAGPQYRPVAEASVGFPPEIESILSSVQGQKRENPLLTLQIAVLRGRPERAVEALERIDKKTVHDRFGPLIDRMEEGLAAGTDAEGRGKPLAQQFVVLRRQLADAKRPVHERFADWSIERLESHLRWVSAALSGYSDPVADILAYMVEKRQYAGTEVHSGVALSAGKRLVDRGESARALPMFLLTQKLGYLSEAGQFGSDEFSGMVSFNGFESSIYFARTINSHPSLQEYVAQHESIFEVAMKMFDYSEQHCKDPKSSGIAGRPGYETMLTIQRWQLALMTGRAKQFIPDLKKSMHQGPNLGIRQSAAMTLGQCYLYETEQYGKAARLFEQMAMGKMDGQMSSMALQMLYKTGRKSGEKAILRRVLTVAEKMIKEKRQGAKLDCSLQQLEELYRRIDVYVD